jgi:hypothetical protein
LPRRIGPARYRSAARRAGIDDPADVRFAQIKCPLLTDGKIQQARTAGVPLGTDDTYLSMAYSRSIGSGERCGDGRGGRWLAV